MKNLVKSLWGKTSYIIAGVVVGLVALPASAMASTGIATPMASTGATVLYIVGIVVVIALIGVLVRMMTARRR